MTRMPSGDGARLRHLAPVLAGAAMLHLGMLAHDHSDPAAFMRADRAATRLDSINGLIKAFADGTWASFLGSNGNLGDYVIHALLLMTGGVTLVMVAQIIASLLSGLAVWRLGVLLGLPPRVAVGATAVYLLLPHTIVFAHQLTTEAWHTPLVAAAAWAAAELVHRSGGTLVAAWGGAAAGLSVLVRPVTLVWSALAAAVAAAARPRHPPALLYAVIGGLVVAAWCTFVGVQTGRFGLGASSRDLGHNLYQRVSRITEGMPPSAAAQVRASVLIPQRQGVLSAAEYLGFVAMYPAESIAHVGRDFAVLGLKSGVERIFIDYLDVNPDSRRALQDTARGWRHVLETQGSGAALASLWRSQGPVLLVALAGSVAMLAWLVLFAAGARAVIMTTEPAQRAVGWILLSLVVSVGVLSLAVEAAQSRHRAPMEFALVLIAAVGFVRCSKNRP